MKGMIILQRHNYGGSMDFLYIIGTCIAVSVFFTIYFYPASRADKKFHHQSGAIFVLNLLLGWTVIGWVVSLIWALTESRLISITDDTELLKYLSERPGFVRQVRWAILWSAYWTYCESKQRKFPALYEVFISKSKQPRVPLDSPVKLYREAEIRLTELQDGKKHYDRYADSGDYCCGLDGINDVLERGEYIKHFESLREKVHHLSVHIDSLNKARLWQMSAEGKRWIQEHRGGWNHQDFEALYQEVKQLGYWPVERQYLGEALEQIRSTLDQ